MKKLTAGIFATILGVTAMGAADAAVTSKGYVDAAVGAVAGDVSTLSQTVEGHTTQINTLNTNAATHATKTEVETVQGNVDTLAGKVGTIPSTATATTVVEYVDEKTANIATDATVRALAGRVTTAEGEIDALQTITTGLGSAAYTESTAYATAAQGATADATAATVATYGDIVTHDAAEFATAAQGTKADTAVQPAAINDMATMTWVEGKGYLTEHQSLAEYAKTADVVTNDEFTAFETLNDAAIADAKKAGTDAAAAAEAAQGTANDALGKANTNATAITNLQAFDNSIKTATENAADGTYALTMKKNAQTGEMEFGWELIDREYVASDVTPNNQ